MSASTETTVDHVVRAWAADTDGPVADQVRTFLGDGMEAANAVDAALLLVPRPKTQLRDDEGDLVVELILAGVSYSRIARLLRCHKNTPYNHWKSFRKRQGKDRMARLDEEREAMWQRHDAAVRLLTDAAQRLFREGKDRDAIAALAERRAALREQSRLTGVDAPARVEHTGKDGGAIVVESPVDALRATLEALAPKPEPGGE